MAQFKKSLLFALFIMLLIFLAMYLLPDLSTLEWKLVPPPPFISTPKDCMKLEGSLAFDCVIKFARERNSDSLCASISNEFYRDRCYTEVNAGKNDESACGKLADPDLKGECFAKFALEQKNPEVCGKAAVEGALADRASDACFYMYAASSGDKEFCSRIGNAEKSGECLYRFASSTMKPEDCGSPSKVATGFCILRLAIDSRNQELCSRLEGSVKDSCYLQIASLKKDQSICFYLQNESVRERCLNQTRTG